MQYFRDVLGLIDKAEKEMDQEGDPRGSPFGTASDIRTHAGPGDLRLAMKFPLIRGAFSMSGQMQVSLPTAVAGRRRRASIPTFSRPVFRSYSPATARQGATRSSTPMRRVSRA